MSLERFGLSETSSKQEVREAFRRMASAKHPDKGGTHEEFVELQVWLAAALQELDEPIICTGCDGLGYTLLGGGFSQMRMTCQTCLGKGRTQREDPDVK